MGLLADLLSWVDSRKRVAKRNIGDLITTGKTRANYLAGLLDPNSQISQDAQAWHKRTQNGLMDQLAGRDTPEAEQAYQTMMQAAGMAPVGMIAWHGSPHKFDKFSLDKIGTGEGAQAYGHGLYLAENEAVSKGYMRAGETAAPIQFNGEGIMNWALGNRDKVAAMPKVTQQSLAFARDFSSIDEAARMARMNDMPSVEGELRRLAAGGLLKDSPPGNLYKTDIPDEAVARFLDWDKPLSQQIEHLGKLSDAELYNLGITREGLDAFTGKQLTGGDLMRFSDNQHGGGFLNKKGIPGIRYLDGGSRSAGNGTSNFVVFDPEMIRILERNGQPTGLQPWKPGEYKLRDLITN